MSAWTKERHDQTRLLLARMSDSPPDEHLNMCESIIESGALDDALSEIERLNDLVARVRCDSSAD